MQTNMMDSPIKTMRTEDNAMVTPSPPSMKRTWLDNFLRKPKEGRKLSSQKKGLVAHKFTKEKDLHL